MRHFSWIAVVAIISALPLSAQAGFIVEGSVGSGYQWKPGTGRTPSNVMIAPGYGLGELIRAELGLLASLGDVENQKFDLELRPMLVIDPPILPLYGRLVLAVHSLLDEPELAYGGALGIGFSLLGLGVFAEAGVIPRAEDAVMHWVVEGRAGAYYAF
jgi:hypothetical protein